MEPAKNGWKAFFFYFLTFALLAVGMYEEYVIWAEDRFAKRGMRLDKGHNHFGGPFKYLTIINMTLDFIYFALIMVNSLLDCLSKKQSAAAESRPLKKLVDYLYSRVAFPMGCLVSITFWAIFFIDRELIYPKKLELVIPNWQNQIMHTLPIIALILDNVLTYHKYSRSFVKGVSVTILFSAAYCVWVLYIAFAGGFWVYPILAVLSPTNRALFFGVLFLFAAFLYKLGESMNATLWPLKSKTGKKVGKAN